MISRSMKLLLVILSIFELSVFTNAEEPVDKTAPNSEGFTDHFNGKYHNAWEVINHDPSHVSLEHRPNALTITTQRGALWHRNNNVKNLFVIENPLDVDDDFVMTTRLDHFNPVENYNQAGLICYDDMDNFLVFSLQWDRGNGGRTLCQWAESEGDDIEPQLAQKVDIINRIWLRITRKADEYYASVSTDGEEYEELGATKWGYQGPAKVGLVAKNGSGRDKAEVAASFDFFELKLLPSAKEEESSKEKSSEDK